MKGIVIYYGDVETISFFLKQIEKQLYADGYQVYTYYAGAETSGLKAFVTKNQAILLTMNFQGIYGEDRLLSEDGNLFVDTYDMPCLNIIVDHPYHYHAFLQKIPHKYRQLCIDKNHVDYMKQYFPYIAVGAFFPSGGTCLKIPEFDEKVWIQQRPIDVIFTGTYMKPECFDVFINRNGQEYADFYHSVIRELIQNPKSLLENVMRRRLIEEIPEVSEEEMKETLGHMMFLDYYVRFYVRGEVIKTLVDQGIRVHVFGSGWDTLECKGKENLVVYDYEDSEECLKKISGSKISLNVLPWFRNGAHDRIFNSMLNGAVVLSDGNEYLSNILDRGEVEFYSLDCLEKIPDQVHDLLNCPQKMIEMAKRAYQSAKEHTWAKRTKVLEKEIEVLFENLFCE